MKQHVANVYVQVPLESSMQDNTLKNILNNQVQPSIYQFLIYLFTFSRQFAS